MQAYTVLITIAFVIQTIYIARTLSVTQDRDTEWHYITNEDEQHEPPTDEPTVIPISRTSKQEEKTNYFYE